MKVYLICGKAGSGKTAIANMMKEEYEKLGKKVMFCPITKYLKHYLADYFDWDKDEKTKPRRMLQYLGVDLIRDKLSKKTFLIDRTIEDINILSEFFDICIIHDVRFPNEIEELRKNFKDNVVIKVNRDNYDNNMTLEEKSHESEIALDSYDSNNYQYIIDNNDIKSVYEQVLALIKKEGSL